MASGTSPKRTEEKPQIDIRVLLGLGALFSILGYQFFYLPLYPSDITASYSAYPGARLVLALISGFGLAIFVALAVANRHRLRRIFRPMLGRVFSTLLLLSSFPVANFREAPVFFPYVFLHYFARTIGGRITWVDALVGWLYVIFCFFVAYYTMCLIISSFWSKWLRFLACILAVVTFYATLHLGLVRVL